MVRKKGLQFLSLVLSFLILASLLIPPVWANEVEYVQESTFWHWLNKQGGIFNGIIAYGLGKACPESPDGYHRSSSTLGAGMLWKDDQYQCVCDYCHQHFWAVESDVKQSYADYVETLPAQGYTSAGRLTWQPTVSDLDLSCCKYYTPNSGGNLYSSDLSVLPFEKNAIRIVPLASGNGLSFSYSTPKAESGICAGFNLSFKVPVSGSFGLLESPRYFSRWVVNDGSIKQCH